MQRYLELITEIAQKQHEHLQQLMDKEKEENIIEQGFGQESHINKDTEEVRLYYYPLKSNTEGSKNNKMVFVTSLNIFAVAISILNVSNVCWVGRFVLLVF